MFVVTKLCLARQKFLKVSLVEILIFHATNWKQFYVAFVCKTFFVLWNSLPVSWVQNRRLFWDKHKTTSFLSLRETSSSYLNNVTGKRLAFTDSGETTHKSQGETTHPSQGETTHQTQGETTHQTQGKTTHPSQGETTHPRQERKSMRRLDYSSTFDRFVKSYVTSAGIVDSKYLKIFW